jgi:hypothetical protein
MSWSNRNVYFDYFNSMHLSPERYRNLIKYIIKRLVGGGSKKKKTRRRLRRVLVITYNWGIQVLVLHLYGFGKNINGYSLYFFSS